MKKLLLSILILSMAALSLFAYDMDFLSVNMSGGFSFVENLPTFGGNAKYQYVTDINRYFYFGLGSSSDFDFVFPKNDLNVAAAVTAGAVLAFVPNFRSTINVMLGPAIYVETGKTNDAIEYDRVSFGISADAYYTYYPGTYSNLGITIGTTGYLLFNNIAAKSGERNGITGDVKAYVGFTWRSGNYPSSSAYDYLVY